MTEPDRRPLLDTRYQCAVCREYFPVCCLARDCERRHEEQPR